MSNWKTTISGIANTFATAALSISLIPYAIPADQLPYLDPTVKVMLFKYALYAKLVFGIWNAFQQKDKNQP